MCRSFIVLMQENGLPSHSAGYAEDLMHDINRHADVVLAGVDALAEAAKSKVPWICA